MRRLLLALGLVLLTATPAAADDGPWDWPLAGPPPVGREFAPPAHAYGTGHRGVDLVGTAGEPVRAAGAGTVGYAGLLAGRGVVTVVHGSLRTTYEPVSPAVAVGQVLDVGEVLGTLDAGHEGCPAAACLHWGLRRGDTYLDPLSLVGAGPVRLLPVPGALEGRPAVGALATGGTSEARVATRGKGVDGDGAAGRAPGAATDRLATASEGKRPGPAATSDDSAAEPSDDQAGFALRAADAPLGAMAVAALVAGIALLHRPRPTPDDPAPASTPAAGLPPLELTGPPAELLDLDEARLRRRPAS